MVIWGSPHFKNPLPLMVTRGPFSRSSPAGGLWTLECADAHGYCRTFIFCPTWGCTCTNQQPVVFFGWYIMVPKIGNEWVFIYRSSWSVFLLLSLFLLSVLVVGFLFPRLFSNEWSPASFSMAQISGVHLPDIRDVQEMRLQLDYVPGMVIKPLGICTAFPRNP